jgi:hypothetical protein
MPITAAPTCASAPPRSAPETAPNPADRPPRRGRTRTSTRRRAHHAVSWIVSPLWVAVALLGLVGLLAVAGLGFATHTGFETTRSVTSPTHARTPGTAATSTRFVSPPIELVSADVSSAVQAACVCSSPYVGAVTGPPVVENTALAKLVDALWRPRAAIGDGSTFDAVEYEATTGQLVGGTTSLS